MSAPREARTTGEASAPGEHQSVPPTHVRIAIIGSGFAGLGMAIRLRQSGIEDFLLFERADDVGGTWRDNTYPGAACDIRSDLYSFSFAPNPDWAHGYGRQPEILDYLRATAQRFGVWPRIRFGHEVERAQWDGARWNIRTSHGEFTADVLVSGHGPLIEPTWPRIPGIESFDGAAFHTARWDHRTDLAGKRVAVIGTGASAIQIVPELQRITAQLTVFQRTPAWVVPRGDRETSARRRWLFRRLPILQRMSRQWSFAAADARFAGFRFRRIGAVMERFATRFRESQVVDPELRAKLTPRYRIGCKRILISSDFYPALTRPNVELVTDAIVRVDGPALVTADGRSRCFDVVVAATGFDATHPPIATRILGADGRSLADTWSGHMSALHGTTVAGFPNLFLLVGPNTALGHNSIVAIIEAQVDYVLDALRIAGSRTIEPRADAQARYNDLLQRHLRGSVWTSGGCSSYYLDSSGRNTTLWPHRAARFARSVRRFDPQHYVLGDGT